MRAVSRTISLVGGIVLAAASASAEVDVRDTSFVAPDGTRVLRHDVIVPATLDDAWQAIATADGWRSWAVPFARMDFRLGGEIESSYEAAAQAGSPKNIRNRILAYVPLRMLAIQAVQAPPGFPHAELLSELWTVIELDSVGERSVRVTITAPGYGRGAGFDALHAHFAWGNPWSLRKLHERFATGPVDWSKPSAGPAADSEAVPAGAPPDGR